MQYAMAARLLLLLGAFVSAFADQASSNPLDKVFKLMDDLTGRLNKEGEVEKKAFDEYATWCHETAQTTKEEISSWTARKEELEAKIAELRSKIDAHTSAIDELAAAIAEDEAELNNATAIRQKEEEDFKASEKELANMVETLGKAIDILEEELKKQGTMVLAQLDTTDMTKTLQALSTLLDGAAFPTADQKKLIAFVQDEQQSEAEAAAAAADAGEDADFLSQYAEHKGPVKESGVKMGRSGGIVEVMEDMKAKADKELDDLRKAENAAKHNYEMLKQSLEAQMAADKKAMDKEKAGRAKAEESKATSTKDLEIVKKELAHNIEKQKLSQSSCLKVAANHEKTVHAREEELQVIAKAEEILQGTMKGAASFLQVTSGLTLTTHKDLARSEVLMMVRRLAKEQHSSALAQLSSRISAVAKMGSGSGDPFDEIRVMIKDMIEKLRSEAREEAEDKAFCDAEMGKTQIKHDDLEEDISQLTANLDTATSKVSELKADIKQLEAELATIAKEQAELDKIRQEERADYEAAKAELEPALEAIRKALAVLKDYYSKEPSMIQDGSAFPSMMQQPAIPETHSKSSGTGNGIIAILEVAESDTAKTLAKEESQESEAQSDYDQVTQESKMSKATKDGDLKYKTKDVKSQETSITEFKSDLETAKNEFGAVKEYYAKVKDRCVAKPTPYEDRKKRRDAEIAGLKEAIQILDQEMSLAQRKRHGGSRRFRGSALVADS